MTTYQGETHYAPKGGITIPRAWGGDMEIEEGSQDDDCVALVFIATYCFYFEVPNNSKESHEIFMFAVEGLHLEIVTNVDITIRKACVALTRACISKDSWRHEAKPLKVNP